MAAAAPAAGDCCWAAVVAAAVAGAAVSPTIYMLAVDSGPEASNLSQSFCGMHSSWQQMLKVVQRT